MLTDQWEESIKIFDQSEESINSVDQSLESNNRIDQWEENNNRIDWPEEIINQFTLLPPSFPDQGEKSFSERNDNGSKNRCVKQKINEFDNLHFLAKPKFLIF